MQEEYQLLTQAQLDELCRRSYERGYADTVHAMKDFARQLKPRPQDYPSVEAMPDQPL